MSVVGMIVVAALGGAQTVKIDPVLWLHPEGAVLVSGKKAPARLTPGARTVRTPFGFGLDLDGKRGGLLLPDLAPLALTRSMTVSTWVFLRSYVDVGPGSQILFRGDDRSGLDPYSLCILADGTVAFGIGGEDNVGASVAVEIPLQRWVHVTGAYDSEGGELRLWLGDRLVATRVTQRRPFAALDPGTAPGVGIGNVQNDHGPHNQPLNGILADLRLYPAALEPREAGYRPVGKEG